MLDRFLDLDPRKPRGNRAELGDLFGMAADSAPAQPQLAAPDYSGYSAAELREMQRNLREMYGKSVFQAALRFSMKQPNFKAKGIFNQKTDAELLAEIAAIEAGHQPKELERDNQLLERCLELLAEVATVRLVAIDAALKSVK